MGLITVLGVITKVKEAMEVTKGAYELGKFTHKHLVVNRGEKFKIIEDILLEGDYFYFHPGNNDLDGYVDHPDGFPNDLLALSAYREYFDIEKFIVRNEPELLFNKFLNKQATIVCTGSPRSNLISQRYLPSFEILRGSGEKQDLNRLEPFLNRDKFKYGFAQNNNLSTLKTISQSSGIAEADKPRKAVIENMDGNWEPRELNGYNDNGWIGKDFLIVSRVPRNKHGGSVLTFCGGHGVGVRAVELLLWNLSLKELKKLEPIRGKKYFQFVLEITNIEHNTELGSKPLEARVADEKFPPVALPGDIIML